jgi:ABC-type cobalamin/Fe3+-siderophores transport system ATPase subunit
MEVKSLLKYMVFVINACGKTSLLKNFQKNLQMNQKKFKNNNENTVSAV